MRTRIAPLAISAVALAYSLPATAAEPLVRFEGGIGIQIVANNTFERNIVRGVQPGGRPWAIQKLKVNIKQDGSISASGEGLVLASGEQIGTRGGSTHVAAQLFCGTAGFTSPAAELSLGETSRSAVR